MAPTYITGYDDSPAAKTALQFTRELAHAAGADVIAAHVYAEVRPVTLGYTPAVLLPQGGELVDPGRAAADEIMARVDANVEAYTIAGGSVPAELNRLARREKAALLAVGATHRGSVGRLIPGSVGERLIHGAPCAVLMVPHSDESRDVRTIAVAYDGRDEARRALRAAASLASRIGASLVLIGAVEPNVPDMYLRTTDTALDRALLADMRGVLDKAAAGLTRRGLTVTTRLDLAPPASSIADHCAAGVDLLVTGSRAYGPTRSVMLGSVSRHLVDHAPCPVLVVPRHTAIDLVADESADTRVAAPA